MPRYIVKTHLEVEIIASDEDEAKEIYFKDLEEGNRTAMTEFAENTYAVKISD